MKRQIISLELRKHFENSSVHDLDNTSKEFKFFIEVEDGYVAKIGKDEVEND